MLTISDAESNAHLPMNMLVLGKEEKGVRGRVLVWGERRGVQTTHHYRVNMGPLLWEAKGKRMPTWLHPILIQVCKVNSKAIWISLPIWSNLQYTFAFTLLFKDWDFPFFSLTHMYSSRQPSLFTDKTHIRKKRKHTTIPNIMLKTHAEKKKQNC